MPATHERPTVRQCLDVAVVRIERGGAGRNTAHAGRQSCLLPHICHRFGVGWRKHIYVSVVGAPDSLVVLGFETSAGITYPVSFCKYRVGKGFILEDSDPALIGILRPLQFSFLVAAGVAASVGRLYKILIPRPNPFPFSTAAPYWLSPIGMAPDRI